LKRNKNRYKYDEAQVNSAPHLSLEDMDAYSDGMMIHIKKYNNIPGTPPGASAIKNARRNQKALIPKNSPSPPQTPAMTRLLMDLRSPFLFFMQHLS
jgi:hypothetical protein